MARRRMIRSPRRRVSWQGGYAFTEGYPFPVPTLAASSSVAATWVRPPAGTLDQQVNDFVPDDWTVIRQINNGCITIYDSIGGNALAYTVGMGVLAWDAISDADPGVLTVPFPVQTPGYDWIWWWTLTERIPVTEAGTYSLATNGTDGYIFTKSQRKLSAGTGLLLVVEVFAEADNMVADWGFSHHHRYAYKLP